MNFPPFNVVGFSHIRQKLCNKDKEAKEQSKNRYYFLPRKTSPTDCWGRPTHTSKLQKSRIPLNLNWNWMQNFARDGGARKPSKTFRSRFFSAGKLLAVCSEDAPLHSTLSDDALLQREKNNTPGSAREQHNRGGQVRWKTISPSALNRFRSPKVTYSNGGPE